MDLWTTWGWAAAATLGFATMMWVASVIRTDASLVDRAWGVFFVIIAWTAHLVAPGGTRSLLVAVLVTTWGLRLSIHLTWRNWGEGEDPRYTAMRERADGNFVLRSLVRVFWLQGGLASVIAVPLVAVAVWPSALTWLDWVAVVVWGVGLCFEAVGDWQLSRFLADPSNHGKVMDQGLWAYTRHPNYFGDTVVWTAHGLFAIAAGAWWAVIGPILMGLLIVKVSGVALTEKNMAEEGSRREGHDEYVATTNAFFPVPRKAATS